MAGYESLAITFDHAAPTEVAQQIFLGDTSESRHLSYACPRRDSLLRLVAVGDEYVILGDDGLQMRADRLRAEVGDYRVGGLAMAIADDQDGIVLLCGKSWFLGLTATLPGCPSDEFAGAFGRLENECLVRLDDASYGVSFLFCWPLRGNDDTSGTISQMNVSVHCSLAQADAINQRAGVVQPFLAEPQHRQLRARQRFEG